MGPYITWVAAFCRHRHPGPQSGLGNNMAKSPSTNPAARAAKAPSKGTTSKAAPAAAAAPASPLPTPSTPTPAAAPASVALRGGPAVAQVKLTGKAYRTAAPHNQQWWKTLTEAAGKGTDGKVAVASVAVSQSNPQGVPLHFVGYALRRGYLQAA